VSLPPGVDVALRPAGPEDLGFLYAVAAHWPEAWPRVCRDGLPVPHQFELVVGFAVSDSRIIEATANGESAPVGAVTLFDADERAGTVWLENVGVRGDVDEAVRTAGTTLLLDEVFAAGRYRKVYARHVSHQAPPLAHLACPVHEEARLVDQVIHDDFVWDEVISAVYRDEWTVRTTP
jgi:hypothetical protein